MPSLHPPPIAAALVLMLLVPAAAAADEDAVTRGEYLVRAGGCFSCHTAAGDQVHQLIAAVQTATSRLVPAVKSGEKAAIADAYTAVANACNACHTKFREEE